MLAERGIPAPLADQGGLALLYREFLRQAQMLSFNDTFLLTSILMISVLPLVLLMRRGRAEGPSSDVH